MRIVIDIPEEQIKKSLKESKYIHEDEGEKGFVDIMMLYTNGQLDFVDVTRKTDFYSCKYKILPKGHGRLIEANTIQSMAREKAEDCFPEGRYDYGYRKALFDFAKDIDNAPTIIEADMESEEV